MNLDSKVELVENSYLYVEAMLYEIINVHIIFP